MTLLLSIIMHEPFDGCWTWLTTYYSRLGDSASQSEFIIQKPLERLYSTSLVGEVVLTSVLERRNFVDYLLSVSYLPDIVWYELNIYPNLQMNRFNRLFFPFNLGAKSSFLFWSLSLVWDWTWRVFKRGNLDRPYWHCGLRFAFPKPGDAFRTYLGGINSRKANPYCGWYFVKIGELAYKSI
jgi:hypothetical protein